MKNIYTAINNIFVEFLAEDFDTRCAEEQKEKTRENFHIYCVGCLQFIRDSHDPDEMDPFISFLND